MKTILKTVRFFSLAILSGIFSTSAYAQMRPQKQQSELPSAVHIPEACQPKRAMDSIYSEAQATQRKNLEGWSIKINPKSHEKWKSVLITIKAGGEIALQKQPASGEVVEETLSPEVVDSFFSLFQVTELKDKENTVNVALADACQVGHCTKPFRVLSKAKQKPLIEKMAFTIDAESPQTEGAEKISRRIELSTSLLNALKNKESWVSKNPALYLIAGTDSKEADSKSPQNTVSALDTESPELRKELQERLKTAEPFLKFLESLS